MTNELLMAKKLRICDRTQAATFRSKFYCQGQKVHKSRLNGVGGDNIHYQQKKNQERTWLIWKCNNNST